MEKCHVVTCKSHLMSSILTPFTPAQSNAFPTDAGSISGRLSHTKLVVEALRIFKSQSSHAGAARRAMPFARRTVSAVKSLSPSAVSCRLVLMTAPYTFRPGSGTCASKIMAVKWMAFSALRLTDEHHELTNVGLRSGANVIYWHP
jgi:hypothetical protein